jgi:hypothetical protein
MEGIPTVSIVAIGTAARRWLVDLVLVLLGSGKDTGGAIATRCPHLGSPIFH